MDFEDTYFEMVQGLFEMEGSSDYKYTFIANYSLENFTLKIEETFNGIIIIQEFRAGINDRQNRFSSFKGKRIDAPF